MADHTAPSVNDVDQPLEPSPLNRAVEALHTQDVFDRAQLAWLMSEAFRWGYEARQDEENAAWPPASYFIAGEHLRDLDRKAYRDACDQASRLPRPGDLKGTEKRINSQQVAA